MKIIKVERKEFEEITTDDDYLPLYRRIEPEVWEHWLGSTHQWLAYRHFDQLEDAYSVWIRKHI